MAPESADLAWNSALPFLAARVCQVLSLTHPGLSPTVVQSEPCTEAPVKQAGMAAGSQPVRSSPSSASWHDLP